MKLVSYIFTLGKDFSSEFILHVAFRVRNNNLLTFNSEVLRRNMFNSM